MMTKAEWIADSEMSAADWQKAAKFCRFPSVAAYQDWAYLLYREALSTQEASEFDTK